MHVGENMFPEDGFLFKIFRKVAETGDSAHINTPFMRECAGRLPHIQILE